MGHLSAEELIDLAEGVRGDESAPHLDACAACGDELAGLRATLAAASAMEVPEPSPRFWEELSERVRHAVEAEGRPRPRWWTLPVPAWRVVLPLGAAAALAVALVGTLRPRVSEPPAVAGSGTPAPAVVEAAADPIAASAADETSIGLMAGLAEEWDWDFAAEAGLIVPGGAVDSFVSDLSNDERIELRRLLQEELSRGGA